MPSPQRQPAWLQFIPVAALLLTIAFTVFSAGDTRAELRRGAADSERRITQIEQQLDRRSEQQFEMVRQIAAANAKLDLILRRTSDRP